MHNDQEPGKLVIDHVHATVGTIWTIFSKVLLSVPKSDQRGKCCANGIPCAGDGDKHSVEIIDLSCFLKGI